jgi:hypothetical protein
MIPLPMEEEHVIERWDETTRKWVAESKFTSSTYGPLFDKYFEREVCEI